MTKLRPGYEQKDFLGKKIVRTAMSVGKQALFMVTEDGLVFMFVSEAPIHINLNPDSMELMCKKVQAVIDKEKEK